MHKLPMAALLALLGAVACSGSRPGSPEAPARIGLCVACHGEHGISRIPGTPHLAGQDEAYLRDSLRRYKSGERNIPQMVAVMGPISDAEIDALAHFYAQLPRAGAAP